MTTEIHGGIEYYVVPSKRCHSVVDNQDCALNTDELYDVCQQAQCASSHVRETPVAFLTPEKYALWIAARLKS